VKGARLFNRLPIDVYLDWLEANVAPAGRNAALKTASLEIPVELPAAWLRYGLDAERWSDAVETIAARFRWFAEVAASMRLDAPRLPTFCGRRESTNRPPAKAILGGQSCYFLPRSRRRSGARRWPQEFRGR